MVRLPEGTVTFLFSDVEGSTRLLERDARTAGAALARHLQLFEGAVIAHGGSVFETVGDAAYAAFARPADAVVAALGIQLALADEEWPSNTRVAARMAIHSGQVELRSDHYFGAPLFRAARLLELCHGGQVLLSGVAATLAADALPDGASLRDLGSHRLKDLGEPEMVHQLVHPDLRADFPPLRGLDAHAHNLPIQLSSFVGRSDELAELDRLLDEHRLVTLLGPGGVGKTRLALQVAVTRIDRHADGAFLVDLQDLRDPGLLAHSIATTLGWIEAPGAPADSALAQRLSGKDLLLILDNVEQLLPGAAPTIAQLLRSAPGLTILVTSRAPLRVRGEQEYPVPPLSGALVASSAAQPPPAIELFLERARAIRPDLVFDDENARLIGEICARLEGLPLAIELAAARLRTFNLAPLNERLARRLPLLTGGPRDVPARQRTLRDAIAWSEELLAPTEQRIFRQLSIFSGGFTLEAAEAVAGDDSGDGVLQGLDVLIEQSLIRQVVGPDEEERFTMLDTIREFALARLEEVGEGAATRDRHLAHFLELGEAARRERLVSASRWFPLIEAEHLNLRAALDWARPRDARAEAQLFGAIAYYWTLQGHVRELLERGAKVVERYTEPDDFRARMLVEVAEAARRGATERQQALEHLAEALAIYVRLGDVGGEATALEVRGSLLVSMGDYEGARPDLERSLAIRQQAGAAEMEVAESLMGLAHLHIAAGEVGKAEPMARQLYELGSRHDSRIEQIALHYLGDCPLIAGDYAEARVRYARALERARRLRMTTQAANELLGVAMALAGQGDDQRAVELAAVAQARRQELGLPDRYLKWWDELIEAHISGARARLGPERAAAAEQAGRERAFEQVIDEVLSEVAGTATG